MGLDESLLFTHATIGCRVTRCISNSNNNTLGRGMCCGSSELGYQFKCLQFSSRAGSSTVKNLGQIWASRNTHEACIQRLRSSYCA